MTDRDPGGSGTQAALRVAARLREDLERQINAVDETVRENATALRELAATVAKLAGGDKGDGDEPQPFWPGDLAADEWAAKRGDLEQWVRDVLRPTYPDVAAKLPPCWMEHPPALTAVLAAWFAWLGAFQAKTRRLDEPMRFVRDHAPALRKALDDEFGALKTAARLPQCSHPDHLRPRTTP